MTNSIENTSKFKLEVNYFFLTFVLTLIFGFYFYEFIGFDPMDEILQLAFVGVFLILAFLCVDFKMGTMGYICLAAFAFYLVYSFYIKSNAPRAIVLDFLLQAKPFIGFFCIYYTNQRLSIAERSILKKIVLFLFFVSLLVIAIGLINGNINWIFRLVYSHPSRFGTALVIVSLLYLYLSDFTWKQRIIFFLMLSIGLFSGRGKFFGYFAFTGLLLLIYSNKFYLKFSFKNIIIGSIAAIVIFFAAKEKILFYASGFFMDHEEIAHNLARPVLYMTSIEILQDYFPFGSGFGSFATHASRAPYSPIYEEYGIHIVWGLSKEYPYFIADTHFPSLAQFGVIGVMLFVLFWSAIIRKVNYYRKKFPDNNNYFFIILIIVFFAIELVADAAFTNNRGFVLMIILGYMMNDYKYQEALESENVENLRPFYS